MKQTPRGDSEVVSVLERANNPTDYGVLSVPFVQNGGIEKLLGTMPQDDKLGNLSTYQVTDDYYDESCKEPIITSQQFATQLALKKILGLTSSKNFFRKNENGVFVPAETLDLKPKSPYYKEKKLNEIQAKLDSYCNLGRENKDEIPHIQSTSKKKFDQVIAEVLENDSNLFPSDEIKSILNTLFLRYTNNPDEITNCKALSEIYDFDKGKVVFPHMLYVCGLGFMLAWSLGLRGKDLETVCEGFLLHDIGKAVIPAEIINKMGKLEEDEYELVKMHAPASAVLLWTRGEILDVVAYMGGEHHTKENPRDKPGIKNSYGALTTHIRYMNAKIKQQIPQIRSNNLAIAGQRMLNPVDAHEAITSKRRQYKDNESSLEGLKILHKENVKGYTHTPTYIAYRDLMIKQMLYETTKQLAVHSLERDPSREEMRVMLKGVGQKYKEMNIDLFSLEDYINGIVPLIVTKLSAGIIRRSKANLRVA